MKVVELKGKDIMKAYDGNYLSKNFGYSCANFNVTENNDLENDEEMFEFYTKNTKNISCIVAYDDKKIAGRRMFFKGPSLINDDEFEVPIKRGEEVKYLYGYYGARIKDFFDSINSFFVSKYGKGIVYTDYGVLRDGNRDMDILKYFILQVEHCNFSKYPPIDHLSICPDLKALANFYPKRYILEVLEEDYKKSNLNFHQAYRYNPQKRGQRFDYKTWSDNYLNQDILP